MARNRNIVILNGPLVLEEARIAEVDGQEVPVAVCTVETDREALGSRHRVLAYGRLALDVAAFWEAGRGGLLDCTVDGWLRTTESEGGVVIADRITFHEGREIAAGARRQVNGIGTSA
ncbi:MAG: hypothetical protein JXM73_12080 [Anaerolineae bacterium]|nr:hypothetical protein [Anaerolineae bacterium]